METIFYDEPSLLTTRKSVENTTMKLNLCNDKVLDLGAKRDELGFGDLADFLVSPDIGISSPDLENLVWKEWNGSLKPSGVSPEHQYVTIKQEQPPEPQDTVTKEQEVFAFGFTEALKKLQETERQESEVQQEPAESSLAQDSSESSDTGSEISSSPENCDAKITFISYTFDSKEPLPSFQEAFSKIIFKKSKDVCLQIKMEKREEISKEENDKSKSENFDNWDSTLNEKAEESCGYEWDNVETVDEGFCSREEIPVDLVGENKYLEGAHGLSMQSTWTEPSDSIEMSSDDLFKDKSSINGHIYDSFTVNSFGNTYMGDMDILDEHDSQKHWLANQGTLQQLTETATSL